MAGQKPNDFTTLSGGLTGDEEIYTQKDDLPRKFTVDDVKTYVENNLTGVTSLTDYSTTETDTGRKWIDGSTVYETVLNIGGAGTITHNLDVGRYLNIRCLGGTNYGGGIPHLVNVAGTWAGQIDDTAYVGDWFFDKIDSNTITLNDVHFDDERTLIDYIIIEYTKN